MKKNIATLSFMLSIVLLLSMTIIANADIFPPLKVEKEYSKMVVEARKKYKELGFDTNAWVDDYDSFGDYLKFSVNKPYTYRNRDKIMKLDENGIPMVYCNDGYYYNPVTIAQYALTKYSQYIKGDEQCKEKFLQVTDFLMTRSDNGKYRYDYPYTYYVTGRNFEPGWVSGLAQGQVLSVYVRAYHLTNDNKYLKEAEKAFRVLITPVSEGGTLATLEFLDPSLKEYIFFDEYPIVPSTYTLNGFIWAMLGVYDWWQVDPSTNQEAKIYFEKSVKTLKAILPYYDAGGFPTYDLAFITHNIKPTYNVTYHSFHVGLVHAIYTITKDPYFDFVSRVWASYVDY